MWTLPETPEVVISFGTLIAGFAAMWGAYSAHKGVNAWKKEREWSADQELAKRALLSAYEFRDSLYRVRHPAIASSETEVSPEELENIAAENLRNAGIINAYANRWRRHSENNRLISSILLEADVEWGTELRSTFKPLFELEHELFSYIRLYIDAYLRGPTELAKDYQKILKDERDILYDLFDAEKDEFRADFEGHLKLVEDYLRTKIGRKL